MVTPGWFIASWENIDPLIIQKVSRPLWKWIRNFGDPFERPHLNIDVEMSIWYCSVCYNDTCDQVSCQKLIGEALCSKYGVESEKRFPFLIDSQVWGILAIISCLCSLNLLVFSFGSAVRVRAGGIAMLMAALFEMFLILRMAKDNIPVAELLDMKVRNPYSVIFAGIGLGFSCLVMILSKILYTKSGQQVTDLPPHHTVLQESD
ncbi:uncharacterized protein LOC133194789 [Saccostrea echinata]|uniref:uncharacterized protein LOC133194789 n=1 Tax=Saccostrea echinata TaxID=191078 RepID=UPI002A7FB43E|nr:uncharacterized protein LOC133194789 [Saccostrea echinata]